MSYMFTTIIYVRGEKDEIRSMWEEITTIQQNQFWIDYRKILSTGYDEQPQVWQDESVDLDSDSAFFDTTDSWPSEEVFAALFKKFPHLSFYVVINSIDIQNMGICYKGYNGKIKEKDEDSSAILSFGGNEDLREAHLQQWRESSLYAPKAAAKPKDAAKPKADTKPKTAPKAKAAAKPKTETKPKAEAKPKATGKPKTAAKPKAAAKPKTAAKPKAEAKPKTATKPKTVAKPKAAPKKK
ncbi:hypothetical protein AGMMS50293_03960 [Spirochaetia bacterium]|nr:hypothetical protein AGMMS50293_03960 [Spirochaetia bacterium]